MLLQLLDRELYLQIREIVGDDLNLLSDFFSEFSRSPSQVLDLLVVSLAVNKRRGTLSLYDVRASHFLITYFRFNIIELLSLLNLLEIDS